ncbi:hypothetical protein KY284_031697 [Solanum tuberosum]|nr:hypothetical protein KY284_031697 [Solanum tuberosum]
MVVLLTNLEVQGWSALLLQGDTQRKLVKKEVTKFYINGKSDELFFTSTVRNTHIHLVPADVARILGIPSEGWGHYVKLEWPPLPNHTSPLSISKKFSSKPNLTHNRGFDKNEMSSQHQLYFDVVHKIFLQRKQRSTKANFLDLTLMELLDTENQLAAKEDQLLAMENAHQMEKASLEARIVELQNELAQERAANIATVQHLTQLLHDPKPTSAS